MKVPFADLAAVAASVRQESLAALSHVYDSGVYIAGPEVEAFEQECASWFGANTRCIGVSNGTDALVCALKAAGVGPGHRVLTTPLTFFATASAIVRVGATPVFADVDERQWLLDIEALPDERTWDAAVVVHLFGRMVNVPRLRAKTGKPIVEDAAQAWGASLGDISAGTSGELGCFSFFPAKPLGACGDAGLVITSHEELAASCRRLRVHGRSGSGTFDAFGGNHRLDEMQAALLRVRLRQVRAWLAARRSNAQCYFEALADLPEVVLPVADDEHAKSAWSVFSLRVPQRRDELRRFLDARGVGTAVYYERPVHLQPAFGGDYAVGAFPVAERLCHELIALPVGPELTAEQTQYVCDCVLDFFRS